MLYQNYLVYISVMSGGHTCMMIQHYNPFQCFIVVAEVNFLPYAVPRVPLSNVFFSVYGLVNHIALVIQIS